MAILVSHAVPDGPWAEWIAMELRAAGHQATPDAARRGFAERIVTALGGNDPVLVLVSGEHGGTDEEWAEVERAAGPGGLMVVLRLDTAALPGPLRRLPCHSLHGLDEEETLDLLLRLVGGPAH